MCEKRFDACQMIAVFVLGFTIALVIAKGFLGPWIVPSVTDYHRGDITEAIIVATALGKGQ